jgi:CxxC motif-containing protein
MSGNAKEHRLLCIVCPEGCELAVAEKDGELAFSGRACKKGREYARREITDPQRLLTSTVRLRGGAVPMLPVKTASPVPKGRLMEVMERIATIEADAPVRLGEVIAADVTGTGIALVACRTVGKAAEA